ncbi:MAG: DJ-1/PfpI family protein [Asgard group archaeon]|nr:DJ-1/PfpI family protein [Asgard group archaeon]
MVEDMAQKQKKTISIALISVIFIVGLLAGFSMSSTKVKMKINPTSDLEQFNTKSLDTMKVMIILGNQFGDSYFWIKNELESWGSNVTTCGTSSVVSSCPNKPPRPVTVNITTSEVTREIVKQFDSVIVPSGAHWVYLQYNSVVHNILDLAHEEGVVVAGICIGTIVLANTEGLVNGVKVAYYSQSYQEMVDGGAKIVYSNVVSDNNIVTAGKGQYQTTHPSIYPFCVAIAKAVFGYSALNTTTLTAYAGETNTTYSFTVETNNLSTIFYGNNSAAITSVKVILNSENIYIHGTFKMLDDEDLDGIFEGNITLTETDNFDVDLEIRSLAWGAESIQSALSNTTESVALNCMFPLIMSGITIISYISFLGKKGIKKKK